MDQLALWLDRLNANLAPVLMTAGVLMAASLSIFLLKRLLQTRLLRVEALFHLPHDISLRITRLVTGTVWLITGILILDIWGVNVGGLWTFLVSTAAVIGVGFLATWTIVSNVTASFFITV